MLKTTTWADGFGRWYASVPITDSRHADAMLARRLILAELAERTDNLDPSAIRVTRDRITNHGTVIYREELAR